MTTTLILTLLPNGFVDDRQLRMSVVAGFQLDAPTVKFASSPLAAWPSLSNALALHGRDARSGVRFTVTRVPTAPASATLWNAIFPQEAAVGAPPATPAEAAAYRQVRTPLAHGAAHRSLTGLYDETLATSPTAPLTRDHPVAQAIRALAELTGDVVPSRGRVAAAVPASARELLDPDRLTPVRLSEAVRELTLAGRPDAARVAALAPAVHRLRVPTVDPAPVGPDGGSPLEDISPIEKADVQQVLGLILDHPALARRLGLIIDIVAEIQDGAIADMGSLRIELPTEAQVRQAFDRVRLPPSRVRLDRNGRRFVMATRSGPFSEVVDGLLDLTPLSGKYELSDLDVHGLARQLGDLGRRLDDGAEVALPIRRDAGLTLTQSGRAGVVAAALDAVDLWANPDEELEGEPVLYADDVTGGYRIDVSRNGGPFRSLMRRHVEYRIGVVDSRTPTFTADDEGLVEGLTAVEQFIGVSGPVLDVAEAMVGWDGYSLAANLPGPVIDPGAPDAPPAPTPSEIAPGYPVRVRIAPTPGTVTPLRYGDTYAVRGRAVDLAGNSLPETASDGGRVSKAVRFLRHEPVPAPTLVPVRPFVGGETLTRLVARSDGDGNPLGEPAERHLAPPPSSQRMAERHGMFDRGIGPNASAAERDRLRVVAGLAGSFNDPVVTRPDGTTVPASGVGVAAPPDATPVALPIPLGSALPPGQYVFHDTDRLQVPYLFDAVAAGATLVADAPGGPQVVTVGFGAERWPEVRPARLAVTAASTTSLHADTAAGASRIVAAIAPGQEVTAFTSSPLVPALMSHLDPVPSGQEKAARDGLVPLLSLRRPITMLHATRKPVADPIVTITNLASRERGQTHITFRATVNFHAATTGSVDLVAEWDEVVDPGVGDVVTSPRRITLASFTPKEGEASFTEDVRHDFGDTKHRAVRIFAVAATKFRDCFPEHPEGDPLTLRQGPTVEIDVRNTRVPPPLQIHSVVPTYRWVRQQSAGLHEAARHVTGVRVYVERPGATTGEGEELGVVVYKSQATSSGGLAGSGRQLVSRWGDDPLDIDVLAPGVPPLAGNFPAGSATEEPLLADLGHLGEAADITTVVGHPLRYSTERGLWFADVDIAGPQRTSVFVRLGLVRRQPHSISSCRVSRTRDTGWFAMPVSIGVALRVTTTGVTDVRVATAGTLPRVTVHVSPRLDGGSAADLLATDGTISRVLSQLSPVNTSFPSPFLSAQLGGGGGVKTSAGTVDFRTDDITLLQRRWRGRIAVVAERFGTDFVVDQQSGQPFFVEVLDVTDIHGPVPTNPL